MILPIGKGKISALLLFSITKALQEKGEKKDD
jgi:hypothetical protein